MRLAIYLSLFQLVAGLAADTTVRWASSGGGWRSMVTNFGYVRAFEKAGLLDKEGSVFEAMSFNSGASWFASQFFYSQKFFDRLVGDDKTADDVYDFSLEWLDSYGSYLDSQSRFVCNALSGFGLLGFLSILSDGCNVGLQAPWYEFISGMLEFSASNVYDDIGFSEREMDSQSRVLALQGVNFMVQMGLSESSRYGGLLKRNSFVSTAGADRTLAVPIPVQYAVTDTSASFRFGVNPGDTLVTSNEQGRSWLVFNDWTEWYGFPVSGVSDIYSQHAVDQRTVQPFLTPFNNGKATVAQIATSSSSNLAAFSGSVPTFLYHHYSLASADTGFNIFGRIRFYVEAAASYVNPIFFNNAICTQSPGECGADSGRFIDGGFVDGPSLAQNIGHHHSVENGDINKRLKIILSDNNFRADSNTKLLAYFAAPFNEGVAPGDFLWAPYTVPDYRSHQETPWRSPQIFAETMNDDILEAALTGIAGTDLTTAEFTLTTIQNDAFRVKAGQTVEVLLLRTNSDIGVNFLIKAFLEADKENLAGLARTIAENDELVTRIQSFLASSP